MKLLLDTCIILWWLNDSKELSANSKQLIINPNNWCFVSAASIWEIRIKQAIGKIEIADNFRETLRQESFQNLPITNDHAHGISELPFHHRDPFDRILISQAKSEGLTILSHDKVFSKYNVDLVLG